jgi:hypothetical protein
MDKYTLITRYLILRRILTIYFIWDSKGELLIEDISTRPPVFVLMFVDLCNKTELSTIHLKRRGS